MKENDILVHYGILGMKWGVRRTPEELGRKEQEKAAKRANREAIRQTKRERKEAIKNISQLSDEELEARLKRAQKEQQLKQYSGYNTTGKSFARTTMEQIGSKAISAAVVGTMVYAGKKALSGNQQSLFGSGLDFKEVMAEVLDRFGR